MKTSSKIGIGVAVLLFVVGGLYLYLKPPAEPPVDVQIADALHEAEGAARHRNLNGIMDVISDRFQWSEWNKDRLRLLILRNLRESRDVAYDVRVSRPQIASIPNHPNRRMVVSRLSLFYSENGENIWGANPATLIMEQETRRHNLFFTVPHWRITGVAAPNFGLTGDGTGDAN